MAVGSFPDVPGAATNGVSLTTNGVSTTAPPSSVLGANAMGGFGVNDQANYEVFDPLNWMLDGLVDFPFEFGNGEDEGL